MTNEIDSIKQHLDAHKYTYREIDGRVIVRDPYHVSGPNGWLDCAGYSLVTLRTYTEALRFISERS